MYIITSLVISNIFSYSSYNHWVEKYFDEYQQHFLSHKLYYTYFLGYFLHTCFALNAIDYMLSSLEITTNPLDLITCFHVVYLTYLLHLFLILTMEWVLAFFNLDIIRK